MTRYLFFSGKGGVGKTTMAAATAIHRAQKGERTLIVTTDPASNLADVFEQAIGHRIVPIHGISNLWAMEIDPDAATREYKERLIGPYRGVMPEDVIASLEENLSGPCTTEMASFDRFIDFMEGAEYEVIVFDTAPTGHTIRLLELPVDWSRHIEESARGSGQTCLGPVQTIQDSKEKYDRATALLRDPERTTFVFVMRPESLSLYETLRARKELRTIGITSGLTVINGILPREACDARFFAGKFEAQQRVIADAAAALGTPIRRMLLRDGEVKGISALASVAAELYDGILPATAPGPPGCEPEPSPPAPPDLDRLLLPVPGEGTRAIFFTGKGGVGKTTVSCVVAMHLADRGFKTLIVTTDPAAHLGEVFGVPVGSEPAPIAGNLSAVMIDQQQAFAEYRERVLGESRGTCSAQMLAAMEEELNSPCTVEMAAFDRFVRFIEGRDYDVVVFDTAPTGHTLRLLDLPFDYARQVEMMVSSAENAAVKQETGNRFRQIIALLRDPARAVFSLVLYPESTPIMESWRAMLDLRRAGIHTQFIVANLLLPEAACGNAFFRNRRRMQLKYLKDIDDRFALPVLRFPLMAEEIRGLDLLRRATAALPSGLTSA
ncbi:MAG TPA: TRC40/GET3/ArsA family transport-energizing ATPase [bacterium]